MKLGFTSTTFKKLQPAEICALAGRAGADCVEWSEPHIPGPEQARDAAARCDDLGIACCSLGSYYYVGSGDAAHWDLLCRTAVAMKAEHIRVWLGDKGSDRTGGKDYAALLADARRMVEVAAAYGLEIAAEAHQNTYNDSCETSLRFLRDLGSPVFGTYFQSLYKDMPADLERLARTYDYLRAAHVSFSEAGRNRLLMPKDDGIVESIVFALKERGFDKLLLLEYVRNGSAEAFLKDMARLRALI